jgi:hypothetical protein
MGYRVLRRTRGAARMASSASRGESLLRMTEGSARRFHMSTRSADTDGPRA